MIEVVQGARTAVAAILLGTVSLAWGAGPSLLRDNDTPLGTRIRPIEAKNAAYPLEKRYDELTAAQKAALKSLWEPMPTEDEPPFPEAGFAQLVHDIADVARAVRARGLLTLVAHVDASGKVTRVDVHQSPDEDLQRFAAMRLTQTAFKPAICGGRACAMQFPFSLEFSR